MENLPAHPGCRFIKCDVNNYDDIAPIFLAFRFDYVFHYAAVVGVKRTLENPVMVLNDLQGIRNVLNLSKNTGVKRVFFSSSSDLNKLLFVCFVFLNYPNLWTSNVELIA